jgi:hypothetical protein
MGVNARRVGKIVGRHASQIDAHQGSDEQLYSHAVIAAGAAVVAPGHMSVSAFADAENGCCPTRYKETEHIKTFYKVNRL